MAVLYRLHLQQVRAGTVTQEKVLKPMSSPSQHYLYISVPTGKFKVNQQLDVTFNTINGIPKDGLVYYLVSYRH